MQLDRCPNKQTARCWGSGRRRTILQETRINKSIFVCRIGTSTGLTQSLIGQSWRRPKPGDGWVHRARHNESFALQRFQSWKIRKLHDGISKKYKRLRRMSRKLWSKAHREKRKRPLLTNVLKHCKNTTRLKCQHLGCSACTIWLTQCSLDGTEILISILENQKVFSYVWIWFMVEVFSRRWIFLCVHGQVGSLIFNTFWK